MPRVLTILAAAGFALLATAGTASAAYTNPYSSAGYDTSSYQCSNANVSPTGYSFGIVRVTGGRPFSVDSCSQQLWTQAEKTSLPSLYENVAYSMAYAHEVPSGCATATPPAPENYPGQYLQAWRIGCAESDYAFSHISTGGVTPTAWWLDVETGNSWSTVNRVLNQAAIDGAVDRLLSLGVPVGVYSYASAWTNITGSSPWAPAHAAGSWVAGFSACGHPFSPLPEWLYQSGRTSWGADADYGC